MACAGRPRARVPRGTGVLRKDVIRTLHKWNPMVFLGPWVPWASWAWLPTPKPQIKKIALALLIVKKCLWHSQLSKNAFGIFSCQKNAFGVRKFHKIASHKAMQRKAMQSNANQWNTMQSNAKQCKAKQCKAMQRNAKRCKAIQSKAMQSNAKQSK